MSHLNAATLTIDNARDAKDVSIAIRNLYECGRLERGLSTSNVAYADVSAKIQARNDEIRRLRNELGIGEGDLQTP